MPSRPANKRRSLSGGQTLSSAYFYLKHTNVFIYFFVRNGHNRQSAEFSTKLAGLHTLLTETSFQFGHFHVI